MLVAAVVVGGVAFDVAVAAHCIAVNGGGGAAVRCIAVAVAVGGVVAVAVALVAVVAAVVAVVAVILVDFDRVISYCWWWCCY